MKRVIIIGGKGSGKTTFAYKLAEKMQMPLVHVDYRNNGFMLDEKHSCLKRL